MLPDSPPAISLSPLARWALREMVRRRCRMGIFPGYGWAPELCAGTRDQLGLRRPLKCLTAKAREKLEDLAMIERTYEVLDGMDPRRLTPEGWRAGWHLLSKEMRKSTPQERPDDYR